MGARAIWKHIETEVARSIATNGTDVRRIRKGACGKGLDHAPVVKKNQADGNKKDGKKYLSA